VIVRFVDISGIVDHHRLINFPFINESHLMALLLLFYISVIIE
jgi:inorganic pyrophosphatase/exopolyphosphatase